MVKIQGPIGVFDSGYGGLTVLKELTKQLPNHDFVYFGDNARAPYGNRSFDVVYEFTLEAVKFLFDQGCPLVILACNTASAKALRTIQQKDLPQIAPNSRVLGVIRPSTEVLGERTKSGHVGILGTVGTISSGSYPIELAKFAQSVGADCQLQVVPYYNKPTQEGLYQHFKAIAEAVDLPMVLYNVPGRTVADMQHDTVLRLAKVPGIVGIKEATGNIERAQWLIRDVPASFSVYSGDDPTAVALMLCGGKGNVSVTANIAPRQMHALCKAALAGDVAQAMAIQFKLMPVHKNLFVEANPIPLKWAMARMGLCGGTLRLPLTAMSKSFEPTVEAALRDSGLI